MRLIVIDDATPARKALSSNENPMVLAKVKAALVASPAPQTSIGGVTGIEGLLLEDSLWGEAQKEESLYFQV